MRLEMMSALRIIRSCIWWQFAKPSTTGTFDYGRQSIGPSCHRVFMKHCAGEDRGAEMYVQRLYTCNQICCGQFQIGHFNSHVLLVLWTLGNVLVGLQPLCRSTTIALIMQPVSRLRNRPAAALSLRWKCSLFLWNN